MDNRKSIIFKQIGAKIAYFRTVRGLTQNLLANKINISLNTLGKIERGKYNKNLSISMLFDILKVCKLIWSYYLHLQKMKKEFGLRKQIK